MIRSTALVVAGALCVAACGDTATESSDDAIPGVGADASGGATIAPTSTATTNPLTTDEECGSDLRTFEVALEAHYAQFGRYPDLEADLVDVGFLRAEFDTYDLVGGEIMRVAGAPCASDDESADEEMTLPTTADGWLDMFTPDQIAAMGGSECAGELAIIAAAAQLFSEREGRQPDTLAEIDGDLEVPVTLWVWSNDTLVPAAGSGCAAAEQSELERACRVDARTLQVAREAYVAEFGPDTEPTQRDLVDAEFIREASDRVDLVNGEVFAVPGSECFGFDLDPAPAPTPSDDADACEIDYRTLQVAIEAYFAQEGREPDNEGQMLDAGILGDRFDTYDVVYGEIVPGDGSPCEAPPN